MIHPPADFTSAKPIKFPCMDAHLVTAVKVVANDYNPNKVAPPEMELLALSIQEDGITEGVVVWHNTEFDVYFIVDGFHRSTVLKSWFGCTEIPVVEIHCDDMKGYIAATVRHNRARGTHQVDLMADIIELLRGKSLTDETIAASLGMEAEEVLRLRQMNKIL